MRPVPFAAGRSLRRAPQVKPGVVQASSEDTRVDPEMLWEAVFAICLVSLVATAVARPLRRHPRMTEARVIIPVTVAFAVIVSSAYELWLGSGPAGVPRSVSTSLRHRVDEIREHFA